MTDPRTTIDPEARCWSCGSRLADKPGSRCRRRDQHVCDKRHGGGLERCPLPRWFCKGLSSTERAERLGAEPSRLKVTAGDVLAAIRALHAPRFTRSQTDNAWLVLEELAIGGRRLDAWAFRCWHSYTGTRAIAYEVKVDKADLRAELEHPEKRRPALAISSEFYLATPAGLVEDPDALPEEVGLMELVSSRAGDQTLVEVRPALLRPLDEPPSWELLRALAYRLRDASRRG